MARARDRGGPRVRPRDGRPRRRVAEPALRGARRRARDRAPPPPAVGRRLPRPDDGGRGAVVADAAALGAERREERRWFGDADLVWATARRPRTLARAVPRARRDASACVATASARCRRRPAAPPPPPLRIGHVGRFTDSPAGSRLAPPRLPSGRRGRDRLEPARRSSTGSRASSRAAPRRRAASCGSPSAPARARTRGPDGVVVEAHGVRRVEHGGARARGDLPRPLPAPDGPDRLGCPVRAAEGLRVRRARPARAGRGRRRARRRRPPRAPRAPRVRPHDARRSAAVARLWDAVDGRSRGRRPGRRPDPGRGRGRLRCERDLRHAPQRR